MSATSRARANTYFFMASATNNLWSTLGNWYTSLNPTPVPAPQLPNSDDSAVITTTVVVDVPSVILQTMIADEGITVNGGLFQIETLQTAGVNSFVNSIITVKSEWDQYNGLSLSGCTVFIQSGAIWYVEQESTGNDVNMANCVVTNDGGITLYDQSVMLFNSGINYLTLLPNAQLTGNGTSAVENGSTLVFDNNGFVIGNPGTFTLQFGNTYWTNSQGIGRYSTSTSNSTIEITGNYELQPGNTNHFIGAGVTELYGNITQGTINGLFQIGDTNGPGKVQCDGSFTGTGTMDVLGTPGVPSTFIWDDGTLGSNLTMNIDPWSQLVLSNNLTKTMSGSVINNFGTTTWLTDNGNLEMDNGAVFNNGPGAQFLVENNATIFGGGGSVLSFLNNAGTFLKTNSSGNTAFQQVNPPAPAPFFNNSGLLDVESGALLLGWGTNSGRFNVGGAGAIEFFRGTNTQVTGANFTGSGAPSVQGNADFWLANSLSFPGLVVNGGTVDGPGDLAITGSLIANGGTYQGGGLIDIDLGASFDITNTATMRRSVNNSGAATNGSLVSATVPVSWNNLPGGFTVVQNGASFDFTYAGSAPLFYNAGTFLNISSNLSGTMNWFATNSGSIQVNPPGMTFSQALTQGAGSTVVTTGAQLNVPNFRGNVFQILGGSLSGAGTVSGIVVNSGTIHPGFSPGLLTIVGFVTNYPSAAFAVEIDGTNAGAQFSQLNDSGDQNTLAGALDVTYGGGFLPSVGQTFMVISNAQIIGTFGSLSGLRAPNGVLLVPEYSSQAVTLVAANSPNISAVSHGPSGTSFDVQTTAGLTNIVEFSPSLSPPVWHSVGTIVGDGTIRPFIDPSATSSNGFYRVRFE